MKTLKEILDYWRDPPDPGNFPKGYLLPIERSEFLFENCIKPFINKEESIMELGCNVGRNLNYLYERGYINLLGVEINPNAIEIMQKEYSHLFETSIIFEQSIEDFMKINAHYPISCIFTMAVLEHIHPDSEWVFAKMVELSRKYIITIEDEGGTSPRHYPRNYKEIFENLGMKQISKMPNPVEGLNAFTCRIFKKDG